MFIALFFSGARALRVQEEAAILSLADLENDDVFCQQYTPSPLCCILPYSSYANTFVCSLYLKKRDKKHQKQGKKAKKAKNLYAFDDFEGTKCSIFAEKAIILLQPRNTSVCDRFLCIRV